MFQNRKRGRNFQENWESWWGVISFFLSLCVECGKKNCSRQRAPVSRTFQVAKLWNVPSLFFSSGSQNNRFFPGFSCSPCHFYFFFGFFFSLKKKKIFLEQPPAAVKQLLISPSGHWNSIGSYFLVSVFFILVPCWGEKRALQLSAERGPKDELSNFPTDLHFIFCFCQFFFFERRIICISTTTRKS